MKKHPHESEDEFETRQITRTKHIFTWGTVGTIAAVVVAIDILFGWNAKLNNILSLPDKFQKLSDIVWQDHQSLQRIEDQLNIRNLETPRERTEISELIGTNAMILAAMTTNNVDP